MTLFTADVYFCIKHRLTHSMCIYVCVCVHIYIYIYMCVSIIILFASWVETYTLPEQSSGAGFFFIC